MRRHRLSLRSKTRQGQITPVEAHETALMFGEEVRQKMIDLGISNVYNADETAVFFEFLPKKTINESGAKTVWVRCAGREKDRATVMLLGDATGKKYPPTIVFKVAPATKEEVQIVNNNERNGFGIRIWKDIHRLQQDTQALIFGNAKGWFNSQLCVAFLRQHFAGRASNDKILILLDDFSGHWTNEVADEAKRLSVVLLKVPPGCTSVAQPADVAWMRPFKSAMRAQWVDSLRDALRACSPDAPFRLQRPNRVEVTKWIQASWQRLKPSTIANGFAKLGIVPHKRDAELNETTEASDDVPSAVTQLVTEMEGLGLIDHELGEVTVDDDIDTVDNEQDDLSA